MSVLYVVDDETAARIKTWAAKSGEGGWQNLCAAIERGRQEGFDQVVRLAKLEGMRQAQRVLDDLVTATEANDV